MILTIVYRYFGTVLQFVILSILANSVSVKDYGLYLMCLGFVFSYHYIVGFGASESAVSRLPGCVLEKNDEEVGRIVGSVFVSTLFSLMVLLLLALLVFLVQPFVGVVNTAIVFVLVFLGTTGILFNGSQLLLGLGRASIGSFFFYPATNLTLLFSTVPTALFVDEVDFVNLAFATTIGSLTAATGVMVVCFRSIDKKRLSWSLGETKNLVIQGIGLTAVRMLHVVSFWIPTMVAGFMLSPSSAGLIGTAGRLAIAVSAVIAAIRFTVRPSIVRALKVQDMAYIRKVAGSVAFLTTALGLAAIVANQLFGSVLIGVFFGENLVSITPILTVLLLSVCAEGIFGPVDEIMKLSNGKKTVGWIYGVGVTLFLAGCFVCTSFGLIWTAWLQVLYVFGIFLSLNVAVFKKFGFFILPIWPDFKVLRSVR